MLQSMGAAQNGKGVLTGSNMIFLKCYTQKGNRQTNTNPVKNTKIGLLYLIELGSGGSRGGQVGSGRGHVGGGGVEQDQT